MRFRKSKKTGLLVIFLVLAIIFFDYSLNLSSNFFLLFPPEGAVMVNENGWKNLLPGQTGYVTKTEFQSNSFTVKELTYRRNHSGIIKTDEVIDHKKVLA
jgi:hypothetical protein